MIIKNVHIFDGNPITNTSDIRIENDRIAAIAATIMPYETEEVIDGKGMIALPGMADAHRHVWQAAFKACAADLMLMDYLNQTVGGIGAQISPEELYSLNFYGYLRAAANGITTIFDWSHIMNSPEHADAALQAATDAGINVLFFHASTAIDRTPWWYNSELPHDKDIERLVKNYGNQSPYVKIGMGIRGPEFATMQVNEQDIKLAKQLNIPVSMHIGSSILGKIHKPVMQLYEKGLLHANMNMVHCNTLSDTEFELMRDAGCLVSMTPEAEMQMGLGNPASKQIAKCTGLKWSAGIDIDTASTDSLIFQQRLLLQHYRAELNNELIEKMEFPMAMPYKANDFFFESQRYTHEFAGMNTCEEILVGKNASLSLLKWDELQCTSFVQNPAFYYLKETNIDTVIANGKVLLREGKWLNRDMVQLEAAIAEIVKKVR